jgi:hypothetical protein
VSPEHPYYGYIILPQISTLAKNWTFDADINDWILTEALGSGNIGHVWDGTRLTTTISKPPAPPPQEPPVI